MQLRILSNPVLINILLLLCFILNACSEVSPQDTATPSPTLKPTPTLTSTPEPAETPEPTKTPTREPYVLIKLPLQQIYALRDVCASYPNTDFALLKFNTGDDLPTGTLTDYAGIASNCMFDYLQTQVDPNINQEYAAILGAANLLRAQHIGWSNTEIDFVPVQKWTVLPLRENAVLSGSIEFGAIVDINTVPVLYAPNGEPVQQPEILESIRFMQWNIEWGAGAHYECRTYFRPSQANSIDGVIEIVRVGNPDILAVNEACYWTRADYQGEGRTQNITGDEIIKDYFAWHSGLNYCWIGKRLSDEDPRLLPDGVCVKSGFNILEQESLFFPGSLPPTKGTAFSGVRVKVQTPGGHEIVIYNAHFVSKRGEAAILTKINQAHFIADLAAQDIADSYRVIVTGDFNHWYRTYEPIFREIGLTPFDYEAGMLWSWYKVYLDMLVPTVGEAPAEPIDQIWISPGLAFDPEGGRQFNEDFLQVKHLLDYTELSSDHSPESTTIYVVPFE